MADNSKLADMLMNMAKGFSPVNPDLIKGLVPANARMLAKSFVMPSDVNESNFRPSELETLKQAYLHSQERSLSAPKEAKDWLNTLNTLEDTDKVQSRFSTTEGKFIPVNQEYEQVVRAISPTIQYNDYPYNPKYDKYGVGNMPASASFTDPAYSMSTTVGRATYKTDPEGNVHVIDTYNFPKGHNMQDYGSWSPAFKLAHALGETFSKDMPVDINLGKVKK